MIEFVPANEISLFGEKLFIYLHEVHWTPDPVAPYICANCKERHKALKAFSKTVCKKGRRNN